MISIVDDDAWSRSGVEDLLQSHGYETEAFESAEQFLAVGSASRTECLITDVQMPGMSGLELQRHLRDCGQRTPVIVITASASEQCRDHALEDGALCFLTKPLDSQALIDWVSRAIEL